MDIPDWVGDTCWGFIIKTWNSAIHFLPSSSYLLLYNFDFFRQNSLPNMVVVAFYWHFEEGDIFCDLGEVGFFSSSPVCRECSFLAVISQNAAIPHFSSKISKV